MKSLSFFLCVGMSASLVACQSPLSSMKLDVSAAQSDFQENSTDSPFGDFLNSIDTVDINSSVFGFKDGAKHALVNNQSYRLQIDGLQSLPPAAVSYAVFGNFPNNCSNVAQVLQQEQNGTSTGCLSYYQDAAYIELSQVDELSISIHSPMIGVSQEIFTMTLAGTVNDVSHAAFSKVTELTYVESGLIELSGYQKLFLPSYSTGQYAIQAEAIAVPAVDPHDTPGSVGWDVTQQPWGDTSHPVFGDFTGEARLHWIGPDYLGDPGHFEMTYYFYTDNEDYQCYEIGIRNKHNGNPSHHDNDIFVRVNDFDIFDNDTFDDWVKLFSNMGGNVGVEDDPVLGTDVWTHNMWNCSMRVESDFNFQGMHFANHPQLFACYDGPGIKSLSTSGRSNGLSLDAIFMKKVSPPNNPNKQDHPIACGLHYTTETEIPYLFVDI